MKKQRGAPKHSRQQQAYRYLKGLAGHAVFSTAELAAATGWKPATARTHIGKHYLGWVATVAPDRYRVLPAFKRVSEEQFIGRSTQARRPFATELPAVYRALCVFDLMVPVRREAELRAALDELFFEDTVVQRLDELGAQRLGKLVPRTAGEAEDAHRQRCLSLIADYFTGYTLTLATGRTRAAPLLTRANAIELHRSGLPYLVDETTAIVRFLVPLTTSLDRHPQLTLPTGKTAKDEARLIRRLFFELFVEAVLRTVAGNEPIRLLEDSPLGRQLHTWARTA